MFPASVNTEKILQKQNNRICVMNLGNFKTNNVLPSVNSNSLKQEAC
jgi:hypothetical protein